MLDGMILCHLPFLELYPLEILVLYWIHGELKPEIAQAVFKYAGPLLPEESEDSENHFVSHHTGAKSAPET
jgi:hypothetical protein